MLEELSVHDGVRVVVTPSQASYFAGERFSVTITMTNMKRPQSTQVQSAGSTQAYNHKRSAHSISSVPMARPPTSPGTRSALVTAPRPSPGGSVIVRRGIVGKTRPSKGMDDGIEPSDQTRKRLLLNRSQSVSVSISESRAEGQDDTKGKSPIRSLRVLETPMSSPTSPRISSPLARSVSVPAHHPHARKHSILDGQEQVQAPTAPSLIRSASSSTFSLTLDSIAESTTSPMPSETAVPPSPHAAVAYLPAQLSASASAPPILRTDATFSHDKTLPQDLHMGLGRGRPPIMIQPSHSRASSSSFAGPNNELILYSYVQLCGNLSIIPLPDLPLTVDQSQTLQTLRRSLMKAKAVGGGILDITSLSPQSLVHGSNLSTSTRRVNHARSSSLASGLLSLLPHTPSILASAIPPTSRPVVRPPHHRRSSSLFTSLFSAPAGEVNPPGTGTRDASPQQEDIDHDAPLPTYEVQPAMLAVDLSLAPGESRSYVYELDLPPNLPPSYRGRTLQFTYEFTFGICRSSNSPIAGSGSHSRVMKVPIRLYNNVIVGAGSAPYDLLWPTIPRVVNQLKSSQSAEGTVTELRDSYRKYQSLYGPDARSFEDDTIECVRLYARNLLSSTSPTVPNVHPRTLKWLAPSAVISIEALGKPGRVEQELSCREAVEILTRTPKKLSYDVNKDGVKVAVLTFTKSAYRLGESILGVVELNSRASRARVLKLSVVLEAHESLPACLSSPPPAVSRQMRRIHAEHHSSFVTATLRAAFALDVPPDASPAFQVGLSSSGSGKLTTGGLEWKIRLYLLVAVASPNAPEGVDSVRLKNLVVDGPRGEWGTAWTAARTIAPLMRRSKAHPADAGPHSPRATQSWTSFLTSTFLGSTEPVSQFHDGDEDVEDEDVGEDSEEDWKEAKVEMVECEVPIKVWPGNTAFKATEVVFDV